MLKLQKVDKVGEISPVQTFRRLALAERRPTGPIPDHSVHIATGRMGPTKVGDLFTTIVQENLSYCQGIAMDVVRDYDAAEDVVQIAFVSVYSALLSFSPEKIHELQMRPWLYTIVSHAALNYVKVQQRRRMFLVEDQDSWLYREETDEYSNPEMVVMHSEERKAFEELLSRLSEKYRKVIVSYVLRKKSYEEIAEEEQCDVRTVRTRFHRASRALAKIVKRKQISESELRRWFLVYTFSDEKREKIVLRTPLIYYKASLQGSG